LFGDSEFQLPDTTKGTREFDPRLMEVTNKELDILKGIVRLELTDTGYLLNARYGVVSPASNVTGGGTDHILIERSFGTTLAQKEKDKWVDYIGQDIIIHDGTHNNIQTTTLTGFADGNENKMLVDPAIIAPSPGDVVDIPAYDATKPGNNIYKLVFAFTNAYTPVASGTSGTVFDVTDASALVEGNTIYLAVESDFSNISEEVQITDVTGTTVTVDEDLGFTPDSTYAVFLVGYTDSDGTSEGYRYI